MALSIDAKELRGHRWVQRLISRRIRLRRHQLFGQRTHICGFNQPAVHILQESLRTASFGMIFLLKSNTPDIACQYKSQYNQSQGGISSCCMTDIHLIQPKCMTTGPCTLAGHGLCEPAYAAGYPGTPLCNITGYSRKELPHCTAALFYVTFSQKNLSTVVPVPISLPADRGDRASFPDRHMDSPQSLRPPLPAI